MNTRDLMKQLFGLAIRLAGLILLYHLITGLTPALALLYGALSNVRTFLGEFVGFALNLVINGVLALWFLLGAPPLMSLAYPERPRPEDETKTPPV